MNELIFPEHIDNSMRKELVKCQKIAHWKFERGLTAEVGNEHLIAGGAFAKGMEVMRRYHYEEHTDPEITLANGITALYAQYGKFIPPSNSLKTADRMAGALAYYAGRRPFAEDEYTPVKLGDELGIEVQFNYGIGIAHPITGLDLSYCGRFDMLAYDKNGDVWVIDEKTTGKLGEAWVHQWNLDSQMTGYCWGAKKLLLEHGITAEVKGAVINGISILKYDYDHIRCPTFRQDWEIERWYAQMLRDISGWITAFKQQDHNQVLDHACALYNNPCQFAKLCKSANPERIMDSYTVRFWDPMRRD